MLAVASLSSCNKENVNKGIGTVEFSLNLPGGSGQLKSVTIDSTVVSYQLMISVEDLKGNSILTDKLIPLYTFGTGFVSDKIEIQTGLFKLTKFMVMSPSGAIVYATPLAGSPLAYLTNKPLPISFNIISGQVTTVLPEVLAVGDQSPTQFGYAAFGVQIITPLDFYTMCILDNPLLMAPTLITTAKLTISDNNGWSYSFNLAAAVNHLIIRGGSDNYNFLLEKDGYTPQNLQFSAAQLMAATKDNPLMLTIPWNTSGDIILILQPGPETGKDAMISSTEPDQNFGTYKYFEATYMPSETALTVMRSTRSLISFDLSPLPKSAIIKQVILRLSYDVPVPLDSTIFVTGSADTNIIIVGGVLQQIIEPWEENKVTWNNQPKTTELNQVIISPFIRNTNFIEVDVTKLFVSPAANPLPDYGMLFKLIQNNMFQGFRFASSDYPDSLLRPRLSIHYSLSK